MEKAENLKDKAKLMARVEDFSISSRVEILTIDEEQAQVISDTFKCPFSIYAESGEHHHLISNSINVFESLFSREHLTRDASGRC